MADANMANFLATDKVPETIFGIPVVSKEEDYTEEDIAFFKAHPEAGGYYDMGDEEGEEQGAVNSKPSNISPLMKKIEATRGTEADVVAALYGETKEEGAARVKKAALARIAKVADAGERARLTAELESGELDLETLLIPERGKNLDPNLRKSRKLKVKGPHKDEIRIVGKATSKPGSHVAERKRILEAARIAYTVTDADLAEMDQTNRSAAYPGASTAVVHEKGTESEELLHLMTRPVGDQAESDSAADAAQSALPWVNHSAAYYVYGARSERLDALQRLKIALTKAYPSSDLNNSAQRATAIKYMKKNGGKDLDDGVKAMLNEYERLERLRQRRAPMREAEKAAWDDLSSPEVWSMLVKTAKNDAQVII